MGVLDQIRFFSDFGPHGSTPGGAALFISR